MTTESKGDAVGRIPGTRRDGQAGFELTGGFNLRESQSAASLRYAALTTTARSRKPH